MDGFSCGHGGGGVGAGGRRPGEALHLARSPAGSPGPFSPPLL